LRSILRLIRHDLVLLLLILVFWDHALLLNLILVLSSVVELLLLLLLYRLFFVRLIIRVLVCVWVSCGNLFCGIWIIILSIRIIGIIVVIRIASTKKKANITQK